MKRKTGLGVLAACGLLLISSMAGSGESPIHTTDRGAAQTTIRVLAYNIHHGAGMDDRLDLERIAAVIRRVDPDLVALQEVDNRTSRTDSVDQAAALGELTGLHAVFGDFMPYRGGHYGMALLSKFPLVRSTNHRLPDGEEPRSALAATIQVGEPAQEIVLVGIHLYRTAEERLAQVQKIVEIFSGETRPVILAGDFNSTPDSEVMLLLGRSWEIPVKGSDHFTFRSDLPEREIDFIIYRPADRFTVVESRVIDESMASDHRPIVLELTLD
jgi:endonuclease/exonuclease/phosphatase family metal-dependent hydrolase